MQRFECLESFTKFMASQFFVIIAKTQRRHCNCIEQSLFDKLHLQFSEEHGLVLHWGSWSFSAAIKLFSSLFLCFVWMRLVATTTTTKMRPHTNLWIQSFVPSSVCSFFTHTPKTVWEWMSNFIVTPRLEDTSSSFTRWLTGSILLFASDKKDGFLTIQSSYAGFSSMSGKFRVKTSHQGPHWRYFHILMPGDESIYLREAGEIPLPHTHVLFYSSAFFRKPPTVSDTSVCVLKQGAMGTFVLISLSSVQLCQYRHWCRISSSGCFHRRKHQQH